MLNTELLTDADGIKEVKLEVVLFPYQWEALSQLCKNISWAEMRANAQSEQQCNNMARAVGLIRRQLSETEFHAY